MDDWDGSWWDLRIEGSLRWNLREDLWSSYVVLIMGVDRSKLGDAWICRLILYAWNCVLRRFSLVERKRMLGSGAALCIHVT